MHVSEGIKGLSVLHLVQTNADCVQVGSTYALTLGELQEAALKLQLLLFEGDQDSPGRRRPGAPVDDAGGC